MAIVEQIIQLPMVQHFGGLLFADMRMQLKVLLVRTLITLIDHGHDHSLFKLVKTNSAFKLHPAHHKILDQEDFDDKMTSSQMCYAAFDQGNFAITCQTVTNWIKCHAQEMCNCNRPPVYDGQGPIQVQGPKGTFSPVDFDLVNYGVIIVFNWNNDGVYAVENGFGVAMSQFFDPVTGPELVNVQNILKPVLIHQSGRLMVEQTQHWNSQHPNAVPPAKKPPPPLPAKDVPVQQDHPEGAALQTLQSAFPMHPKGSSAPPTIHNLPTLQLAGPVTVPIAKSHPAGNHAVFQKLPLTVGAKAQSVPPPMQPLTGQPPVQPSAYPIGVTLNNGVLSCQYHWKSETEKMGHGRCLVCDYCYDHQPDTSKPAPEGF